MSTEPAQTFADGIGNINFSGGMVRIDLVSLNPAQNGQAVTTTPVNRVVMPVNGLLQSFATMQQFIDKLVEAGVLQRQVAPSPEVPPTAAPKA